jgi:hypothetical protein
LDGFRIQRGYVAALLIVAAKAGIRQIIAGVASTMLHGNNVIDLVLDWAETFRLSAVFAACGGTFAHLPTN